MKKTLLTLLGTFCALFLFAQESSRQQEVGLLFKNLDAFGLSYKIGNEKSMWRFSSLMISGGITTPPEQDEYELKDTHFGGKISAGKEFRKSISDKCNLIFGADVSFMYNQSVNEIKNKDLPEIKTTNKKQHYSTGINAIIGFNFLISDNLLFGAELLPDLTYSTSIATRILNGEKTKKESSQMNYGLTSSSAQLSIAYRF